MTVARSVADVLDDHVVLELECIAYTAKLCINGNEWAKRQAAKAGIRFEPLDNGFASCQDVPAVQAICDSLGPEHIDALLRKWLAILPTRSRPRTRPPATAISCRSCRRSSR